MRTRLRILGAAVVTSVAVAAVPILTSSDAGAARFTIDNLVVYRVGTPGGTLTNAAAAVTLVEYTASGTPVGNTIPLPTTAGDGNAALTASGLSRSEGLISRSADGKYLAVTGYDATVGTTAGTKSLTATAPASTARVVGIVDANGTVDSSTSLTAAGTPSVIRSAVTDGDRIWATGGNGGILTTTLGSGSVATVAGTATSNFSSLTAQGGQLFASGIVNNDLTKVGSGFPSAAGATLTDVPGLPAYLLAYGYAFFDLTNDNWAGTGYDTLYVADASNRAGTLDKYRYNGTTWALTSVKDVAGISGLVASINTGNVSVAATTPSKLVGVLDTGAAGSGDTLGAPATLATAPSGTEFRGVALAPTGTPGPSAFVRSPATGQTVNISSAGVPVNVYAKSPGGPVTGVTLSIGANTVNATKGAGDQWSATVPNTGLAAGPATLTVAVTGPGGTTTVTRSITLGGNPPVVTPPGGGGGTTTTTPKDALLAGKHAPNDGLVVAKGKWKSYKTSSSPTKKGLRSAKKKSTLTTKVYGSQVVITFDKSSKSGQVSVVVDGKKKVIDLYNAKPKTFAKAFKFSGALASHTVVITVLGTKKTKSTGVVVSVASLEVK